MILQISHISDSVNKGCGQFLHVLCAEIISSFYLSKIKDLPSKSVKNGEEEVLLILKL